MGSLRPGPIESPPSPSLRGSQPSSAAKLVFGQHFSPAPGGILSLGVGGEAMIRSQILACPDRLYEAAAMDEVERGTILQTVIVAAFVIHMLFVIAFIQLQGWERAHPRKIPELGLTFEFSVPPINEVFYVRPKEITLTVGDEAPVAQEQGTQQKTATAANPIVIKPAMTARLREPNKPGTEMNPSRRSPVTPPISLTTTNQILAAPPAAMPGETISSGGVDDAGNPGNDIDSTGSMGIGGGATLGAKPPEITLTAPKVARLNITPYRRDLEARLKKSFHPNGRFDRLTVSIVVASDGTLLHTEIIESSGKSKIDREALRAVREATFAPLPPAYKGDSLTFSITMTLDD